MPILRHVQIYPFSGFYDRRWGVEGRDESTDRMCRISRALCEVYSEEVRAHRVAMHCSILRISAVDYPPGRQDWGWAKYVSGAQDSMEWGHICAPERFSSWEAVAAKTWVLDAVHSIAVQMAEYRGLDPEPFEAARAAVLAAGFAYRLDGAWKSAPGRRLRARPRYWLHDDGFGRAVVEVSDPTGTVVAQTPQFLTFTTSEGMRRSARTLRWVQPRRLQFIPFADPLGLGERIWEITVQPGGDGTGFGVEVSEAEAEEIDWAAEIGNALTAQGIPPERADRVIMRAQRQREHPLRTVASEGPVPLGAARITPPRHATEADSPQT